jgi:putative PIG3 family NAD(P)H quinone oxidoreductase
MRAVIVDEPGGPEVLRIGEVEDPVPDAGEVLVRVRAAGVNRADLLQRMGRYPPPPGASPLLGLELAGEVVAVGPGCRERRLGDRVMALVTGGGYAELAAVPEAAAMTVPEGMEMTAAGGLPEAFLTAWHNLVDLGGLEAGERVLIHAGASGVGSAAIQLVRERGAHAFATAGTEEKLVFCRELGAEEAWSYREADFAEEVMSATGGEGVHLVVDFVGAPYWERNLRVLRRGGRLVLIGFLGGSKGDLDLGPVLRKSLTVRGTTLRGTPLAGKARIVEAFTAFGPARFETGRLRVPVDRVFPLEEAGAAHAYVEANRNLGKVVLEVGG